MREASKAAILTLIALAVLIPFASSHPDGLERVAETLGVKEHQPVWTGLMPDYSLGAIKNEYLSTLISGIVGFALVFVLTLTVSKKLAEKQKHST